MQNDSKSTKTIRVNHIYKEDLDSHFVSSLIIQHQPEFFILSFFELWPPPIIGTTNEEKKEALEKLDRIEANCVARIVVTPTKMREFVKAMTDNLKNYEKSIQNETKDE